MGVRRSRLVLAALRPVARCVAGFLHAHLDLFGIVSVFFCPGAAVGRGAILSAIVGLAFRRPRQCLTCRFAWGHELKRWPRCGRCGTGGSVWVLPIEGLNFGCLLACFYLVARRMRRSSPGFPFWAWALAAGTSLAIARRALALASSAAPSALFWIFLLR